MFLIHLLLRPEDLLDGVPPDPAPLVFVDDLNVVPEAVAAVGRNLRIEIDFSFIRH